MIVILQKIVSFFITLTRYWLKMLFALNRKLNSEFNLKKHEAAIRRSSNWHNMLTDADEQYYAKEYWHHIQRYLALWNGSRDGHYLDLGCGSGRMTMFLAEWCQLNHGQIDGIDFSAVAIQQAQEETIQRGYHHVNFKVSDIKDYVSAIPDATIDIVFFLEVAFCLPNYRQVLQEIVRVLKRGGILVVSFRPQYFNALCLIQENALGSGDILIHQRSGHLWSNDYLLNWNTSEEIKSMLVDELKLELELLVGIGCCSGIKGDPLSQIARPSNLNQLEQKQLMMLETLLGETLPDAGRYILAIAKKSIIY